MSLEDVYKEVILDHYRAPRNVGTLPSPPAIKAEGFNPLCGDEITLYLDFEGDSLKRVKMESRGCSISQASASMMTEAIQGKRVADIQDLVERFKEMMSLREHSMRRGESEPEASAGNTTGLGELEALQGVVKFPIRIKCATLAWNTLLEGLKAHAAQSGPRGVAYVEGERK